MAETQSEWEFRMSKEVLDYIKGEIYLDLPFMELALSALEPAENTELTCFATDGGSLYYGPAHMIDVFKKNERFLERAYLHSILHCIYAQPWIAGSRERNLWNLSCDIAVEYVIDHLNKPCTKRILGWQRQKLYEEMERHHIVSAAEIYEYLRPEEVTQDEDVSQGKEESQNEEASWAETTSQSIDFEEHESKSVATTWNLMALSNEFFTDDHRYWPQPDKQSKSPRQQTKPQQNWQKIARQMKLQKDKKGNDPEEGEQLLYTQIQARNGQRTYGDFLRHFAVRREELHLNMDEFDLSYYTYGLEHYGNIPLIEPLETKEDHKIQELIVVVDTSYSTSGELVEGFLKETFTILKQKDAFFHDYRVHVIQCDDEVKQDVEITSEAQMDALVKEFQLQGGGNTDFRPAFEYVKELRDSGKIKNPGGLLYFTDGNGTYPKKKPDFKTAFLFLNSQNSNCYENSKNGQEEIDAVRPNYGRANVPAWAMQLEVEKEELRQAKKNWR